MKKICANPECRKEFESNYKNKRFCCKECYSKVFYQEHKEYWNPEPKRKIEAEQKRIEVENKAKREKRRNDINRLMAETGLKNKYGLVASFYDNNDLEGLYKYVDYLKSIGEIKEETPEPRIVKSHGGKITGGFDYFMISTE